MLGHGALGQFALGEAGGSSTVIVISATGSYTVTGNAAQFNATLAASAGAYTLVGSAAAFVGTMSAAAADYAVAGSAATFSTTMLADTGVFAVSGGAEADVAVLVAEPGAFTVHGNDAFYRIRADQGSVGSSISAGTFSRGKWRSLQEQKAQLARAREIAEAKKKKTLQLLAAQERAEKKAAAALEWDTWLERVAQNAALREQVHAVSALHGMQSLQQLVDHNERRGVHAAGLMQQQARAARENAMSEDEEAYLLLGV